jgi:hypothetical protein
LPTNKTWEVLIGKTLANQSADLKKIASDGSIVSFLGLKIASNLLPSCEKAVD